jgi:ABC-type polysaccharide/polyol phosphate export permease
MLNPLTFIIEQARNALVWGFLPDWADWASTP